MVAKCVIPVRSKSPGATTAVSVRTSNGASTGLFKVLGMSAKWLYLVGSKGNKWRFGVSVVI